MVFEVYDGGIHLRDQIHDYVNRGDALEDLSYLKFFLNIYDMHLEGENNICHK